MEFTDKNILIISHNPLSFVSNNGKTLASIFDGAPKGNIYQIYLNREIPDYSEECHYLQINEKQIISSLFRGKNLCCNEVKPVSNNVSSAKIKRCNFGNHTKRLLRECIWKLPFWKSKLKDWLADKRFDVVFLMAGDGLFAYDVYHLVMESVCAKGCVFFTDDYIIGKKSSSPIAHFRQIILKQKMKAALNITKDLYVISEEMREAYNTIFNVDGYVIRNFSVERRNTNSAMKLADSKALSMVYAGGLHYNRWKTLSQIANVLKKINQCGKIKCYLKIYSSQNISKDIIEQISVENASEFLGGAKASQIADIYADADILLHVESLEKKSVAATKYSFSTKIPEYLSAGRCVLAVGPKDVASIRYLSDFACTISDNNLLQSELTKLINDDEYRKSIRENCEKRYEKDFSKEKQEKCLERILCVS